MFASIQGEGLNAGRPAIFVRFQGCPNRCPWCDTKYAQSGPNPGDVTLADVCRAVESALHCAVTPLELACFADETFPGVPLVVLTGGEPCTQDGDDLAGLCSLLARAGRRIQVETSGTAPLPPLSADVWVTCSPKEGAPGGLPLLEDVLRRADEIKMVVGGQREIDILDNSVLPRVRKGIPVSLQPLSCGGEATRLCMDTVLRRGRDNFRLSIQMQKYMDFR